MRIPSAGGFRDVILGEAMDEMHIRSQQVFDAGNLLDDETAVMHHEFQVEGGDRLTGAAGTGGMFEEIRRFIAEGAIGLVDQTQQ